MTTMTDSAVQQAATTADSPSARPLQPRPAGGMSAPVVASSSVASSHTVTPQQHRPLKSADEAPPPPPPDRFARIVSSTSAPNMMDTAPYDATDPASYGRNQIKRENHNATERARRENLNGRFQELANCVPSLADVRKPSKHLIVSKACDYVLYLQRKSARRDAILAELHRENMELLHALNRYRTAANQPALPVPAVTAEDYLRDDEGDYAQPHNGSGVTVATSSASSSQSSLSPPNQPRSAPRMMPYIRPADGVSSAPHLNAHQQQHQQQSAAYYGENGAATAMGTAYSALYIGAGPVPLMYGQPLPPSPPQQQQQQGDASRQLAAPPNMSIMPYSSSPVRLTSGPGPAPAIAPQPHLPNLGTFTPPQQPLDSQQQQQQQQQHYQQPQQQMHYQQQQQQQQTVSHLFRPQFQHYAAHMHRTSSPAGYQYSAAAQQTVSQ